MRIDEVNALFGQAKCAMEELEIFYMIVTNGKGLDLEEVYRMVE